MKIAVVYCSTTGNTRKTAQAVYEKMGAFVDGCFDLEQVRPYPDPTYGRAATLCFDPETGALRYLRRELDLVVEEQEAVVITAQVGDADFDLADDPSETRDLTGGGAAAIREELAALLAAGVILFMKNSRMGQAIRATAQDARAARVLGIDTEKVYAFTFSLNAAICGAAGAIIVMVWVIQPFYGITHSIRAGASMPTDELVRLPTACTFDPSSSRPPTWTSAFLVPNFASVGSASCAATTH